MLVPSVPLPYPSGFHVKRRAALGSCHSARAGTQIASHCLIGHEDRAQHVIQVSKRKRGGEERNGSHVTRRGDSSSIVKQRHQKQELVSQKYFIAVNKRILSSSSITDLARLVSQEKKLNEVNVCSATTQLHRLLRQLHDTKGNPHHCRNTEQTASATAAEAAQAAEVAAASQMLPTLVNATLSANGLSPDHCMRILTAHAWMKQLLPPQAWQLQQQPGTRVDSSRSSSSNREAWHRMLHQLCSTLATASTTTPPEHLSRGLWACARLGHVHAGLVAAASARLLHLVQGSHSSGMPQQQQHSTGDGAEAGHQEHRENKGSGTGISSTDDGGSIEGDSLCVLPASVEAPLSPTVSPFSPLTSHTLHQQTLPTPQHALLHPSPPSLPDTLSNLVWALGQLLLPPAYPQTEPPLPQQHAPHNSTSNSAATMVQGHKAACTPEAVQLVAAVQQRIAQQPEWLARWGPQRMATLMHGLANLQLARVHALNTVSPVGTHGQVHSIEHFLHLAGTGGAVMDPLHHFLSTPASPIATNQAPGHASTPTVVPPTSPTLILALCQSVHSLLAGPSPPMQPSTQQAGPRAAQLHPQALSNMAWSLATLWSLVGQQPAKGKRRLHGSHEDANHSVKDTEPAARSSMASSTHGSSTIATLKSASSSAIPGAPFEREPQAHELHAACAHAVRALAHAALGGQGDGMSRFSPHELCSLLHAVADLHAVPPPNPMKSSMGASMSVGTPAAAPGHSSSSESGANCEQTRSSNDSNSIGSNSSTSAGALNSQRSSMYTIPSGISPPYQPPIPPQTSQPAEAGVTPASTLRPPAPMLPSPHAYTHSQQPPAVATFLHRVFAAALDSAAARVVAFTVVDCCEVLHACAMVGLPSALPAAKATAPHQRASQQQAQQRRVQLQALSAHIEAQPQALPPSRVPMLLWSLARLGLVPGRLLAYLLAPSVALVPHSTTTAAGTGPSTFIGSFSQAGDKPSAASSNSDEASSSSTSRGREKGVHRVGAGRDAGRTGGNTHLGSALAGLSPDCFAKVAWALATMAQCSHADVQQQQQQQHLGFSVSDTVQQELQQWHHPTLEQQQQQQQQQDCDPRALALSLLLRLEPDAVQLVEAMDNQSLCMVLWAFASNRCHCPRLLAAAAPELLRRCMVSGAAASPAATTPVPQPATHSSRAVSPPPSPAASPLAAAGVAAAPPPHILNTALASAAVGKTVTGAAAGSMPAPLLSAARHTQNLSPVPAVAPSPAADAAAAAAPQASSASKLAAGAAPGASPPVPASAAVAAAALHPSPPAPSSLPSATSLSQPPAGALPHADTLHSSPLLATHAAVGMNGSSSSSDATITASRRVRLGSSKLRRSICLRRPGPVHVGLRRKLHSRLHSASTRNHHASPPIGSITSTSTSSSSNAEPGADIIKGMPAAALTTWGLDGYRSGKSSKGGITSSSSTKTTPASSSLHTSSTSSPTNSANSPRAAAPQNLSCQQLAMALWAVARLLEAGHNQLGASMAPLRLFRAAAPAVAQAAATAKMDAKNLAMVTWAYASVKVNPGERVLTVLAHSSLRAAPRMSMQGLAMVVHALAKLSYASPPLYAGLAAAMLTKAQQLPLFQPLLYQPLSQSGAQQLQQQQRKQQQQQYPGMLVPTARSRHDRGTAVAALSSMALVLACMGVPCPQIMDAAVAAALAAAARGPASVDAGAAAAIPSIPSPAGPPPQAVPALAHAPHAAPQARPLRASPWQAAASDAAPTPTHAAQSLQQEARIRQGGAVSGGAVSGGAVSGGAVSAGAVSEDAVSAVELVQLLFALGRAKHPCGPRKLDALVGMLSREMGLPGLPVQQPSGQAGRSLLGMQQGEQHPSEQQLLKQQEEQSVRIQQQEQTQGLSHHSPGLLAMFLMACVSLRYQPPHQLLTAVCCALEGNVTRLSTQTVCELLSSLAALQHDPGEVLLDELVGVVEGRVMLRRQELLTLESLVKLAWGLACLKQYKRPLFKRAVRRALGSSAGALNERPQLLRQLLELKMLFQVERRAGGYWHMLRPCWERRVAAGGADRVPEAVLLQSAGLPAPELASAVRAVEAVKAQVLVMLHALGVDDPKWHSLRQGDQACMFHYVPGRRRGRSNSWEQQLQQQQQQQRRQVGSGLDEAGSANSTQASSGSSMERAASSRLGDAHGRDGGQEGGVGPPGSGGASAVQECGGSSVAFEGRRPTRSKKLAVTLLAPWHLSVNAGGVPLASAALRDRILTRKQCSVLAVRVEEWLALSVESRRQILLGFLFG